MLNQIVTSYYRHRRYVSPSGTEALLFLISEIGELAEAYIEQASDDDSQLVLFDMLQLGKYADRTVQNRGGWVRNNDREKGEQDIADEIGDVMMMLHVFAARLGLDPTECMIGKMRKKGFTGVEQAAKE